MLSIINTHNKLYIYPPRKELTVAIMLVKLREFMSRYLHGLKKTNSLNKQLSKHYDIFYKFLYTIITIIIVPILNILKT